MLNPKRRSILGSIAAGAGALAATHVQAGTADGHAAGHDVAEAPKATRLQTIPRRPGDPVVFTASLDGAPLKATSGGWAREVTARTLPIATGIAGAHLFVGPGGLREMHWHGSAEWAYILDGRCQVTVVDPAGETEVVNYEAGDLWYFPAGHAHAIQTLGLEPCHAILAFNDGLYGEHGTFGLTDWMSRLEPAMLGRTLNRPAPALASFPPGETYIMQGPVLPADGPEAMAVHELAPGRTHRHRLMAGSPSLRLPGGSLYVASAREFPRSGDMSGLVLRLEPGAAHTPHWHPSANEWLYMARGRARVTVFGTDKRLAVAELAVGDCAYLPRSCGHSVENIGGAVCEIIGVTDSGEYVEASLADWFAHAPRHVLAANLGVPVDGLPRFGARFDRIAMAE
jgi:oxalate decarboxylase